MGASLGAGSGGGGGRRGGRIRRSRRSAPMAEINVTPFVDVMLVLLIVFMISAPLLTVGVPLDLPESRANALPREQGPPITISIDADGVVFLGEDATAIDTLPQALAALAEERGVVDRGEERIYVRADLATQYGAVAQVIGALNANGFTKIAFPTRPSESTGS